MNRWPIRRRVLVNLIDGKAIGGVLWKKRGPLLVLRNAELHEPGGEPAGMDGAVFVERSKVLFIQVGG